MRLPTKGTLIKRGASYRLQWKHGGRPYARTIHAKSEDDARRKADRMMVKVRSAIVDGMHGRRFGNGEPDKPRIIDGDIRLADAWAHFEDIPKSREPGDATMKTYAQQWRRFETWMGEHHPRVTTVGGVTDEMARNFAKELATLVGESSFNRYRDLCLRVFRLLLGKLGVDSNPWEDVLRKRAPKKGNGREPFEEDEVSALMEILVLRSRGQEKVRTKRTKEGKPGRGYLRRIPEKDRKLACEMLTVCLIGYHTGLRLIDCCLLPWEEVEMGPGLIRTIPHKIRRSTKNPVIIPIHPELFARLREIRPANASGPISPLLAAQYRKARDEVTKKFCRVLRQAGIRIHREGTGKGTGQRAVPVKGFHSFRKSFVRRAYESGWDRGSVLAVIGWNCPDIEELYGSVSEGHLREQMRRLSPALPVPDAPGKERGRSLSDAELEAKCEALRQELERRREKQRADQHTV